LHKGFHPGVGGAFEVGGGVEDFLLFREEEAGLREEDVLAANEVRVKFESIACKRVGLEDLRDRNGRGARFGGRK